MGIIHDYKYVSQNPKKGNSEYCQRSQSPNFAVYKSRSPVNTKLKKPWSVLFP